MAKIATLLILTLATSVFSWTVSPDGLTQIAGAVEFNPYEQDAYVVVGDRFGEAVQILKPVDLEVVSARCIAGISCQVTWQAQLDLPCGVYDLLAVLRQGEADEPSDTLDMGQHRIGCIEFEQFLPVILGGGS